MERALPSCEMTEAPGARHFAFRALHLRRSRRRPFRAFRSRPIEHSLHPQSVNETTDAPTLRRMDFRGYGERRHLFALYTCRTRAHISLFFYVLVVTFRNTIRSVVIIARRRGHIVIVFGLSRVTYNLSMFSCGASVKVAKAMGH